MIRTIIAMAAGAVLLAGCGKPFEGEAQAQVGADSQIIGFTMAGVTPMLLVRRSGGIGLCSLRMNPDQWNCAALPPLPR